MKRMLLFAMAVVSITGCAAQTASIRQLQSAQAMSLPRRLAVLDVVGGNEQAAVAQAALVSQMRQSGFYILIDEAELQLAARTPLRNQNLDLNMPIARAAAQQLGIDALLLTALQLEEANGAQYGSVTIRMGDPHVAAKLQYQLIDARTGKTIDQQIIASDVFDDEFDVPGSGPNSRAKVLSGLTRQAASRLAQKLSPHTSQVEVRLAGKSLGKGVGAIRRGNKAAQVGNWEAAVEHWNEAIKDDPRNHAAWYNLGLAFEALHRYEPARQAFERALKIHKRTLYSEGLARCGESAAEYHQAIAQRAQDYPGHPATTRLAQRSTYPPTTVPAQPLHGGVPRSASSPPFTRLPAPAAESTNYWPATALPTDPQQPLETPQLPNQATAQHQPGTQTAAAETPQAKSLTPDEEQLLADLPKAATATDPAPKPTADTQRHIGNPPSESKPLPDAAAEPADAMQGSASTSTTP